MPQNLLVNVTAFGAYQRGDVIPEYEAGGHDLDFLIARGVVARTDQAVSVEVAPKAASAPAVPDDVYAERNRLFQENAGLQAEAKGLAGQLDETRRQRDGLRAEIARYVEANAHLEARVKELTAELEAATAPAVPKAGAPTPKGK